MGTLIERVVVSRARLHHRHSAFGLAVKAAKDCLRHTGRDARDVDLLVNAGIYRDRNLGEPALAAMIQDDIHANPEDPHDNAHGTFSFDIANGTCGILTALQIVDGFMASGAIDCALVVASDADPGHGMSEHFPFSPAGAAMLCSRTDNDAGIQRVYWVNADDAGETFRATVGLVDNRNILRIDESADLDARYADAALKAVQRCLSDSGLSVNDLAVIVAAPARAGFRSALAQNLDVQIETIVVTGDAAMHTAALAAAYEAASVPAGGLALLVTAGAGVTAGAVLYHMPK